MSDVLDEDSAEIAFAALGLKVDGLGVQLARLEKLSKRAAIDYAPTLATISGDLARMELAVRALYGAPALKMPVEEFERQLASARAGARSDMERALNETRDELHRAGQDMQVWLGQARKRAEQNWRLFQVGIGCWMIGVMTFVTLYAPLARVLPAAWAIPERMAVAVAGDDPWSTAERLMTTADPARWRGVLSAETLIRDNETQLASCQRRATQLGRYATCAVRMRAPAR